MNKLLDLIICISLNLFGLIIWCYKILASSDIPVVVSHKDAIIISLLLISYFIFYRTYLKKTHYLLTNFALLFTSLLFWGSFMNQALENSYHPNDTFISILGFSLILIMNLGFYFKRLKGKV